MPQRYPLPDCREWLNRARSNLALTKSAGTDIYLEDLCFNAQQAVEKAIKALLIKYGIEFPYTHDIAELLTLLQETSQSIPDFVKQAAGLTRFAVALRYPHISPSIKQEEYEQAAAIAEQVVRWAESLIFA